MSGGDEPTIFAGIAVRQIEGEARVSHVDVAKALAYAQARILAKLVTEHAEKLSTLGVLHSEVQNSGPKGGRRGEVFYLNRKQVLYLCAKSEQPLAIDVTTQMVHVFDHALTVGEASGDAKILIDRVLRLEATPDPHKLWVEECIASLCRTYRIPRVGREWPPALSGVVAWIYPVILGPTVYAELKARNPGRGSDRKGVHYSLFQECLRKVVVDDLRVITALSNSSASKEDFKARMLTHYRRQAYQLALMVGSRPDGNEAAE